MIRTPAVLSRVVIAVLLCTSWGLAETPGSASAPAATQAGPVQPSTPLPAPPANAAPETQALHIQVGRSVVISTQSRIRRVLISNQGVVETATISAKQLVVTAKSPGTSSLVMWDDAGSTRMLDVYADVDVAGLRDALRASFPTEDIQVEADQGRIILSNKVSNRAVADAAVKMAGLYSKEVVDSMQVAPAPHAKQLLLKVRFAEVNRAAFTQLGLNILSTGATKTIGTTTTGQFGGFAAQQINDTVGARAGAFTVSESINDVLNVFLFRPDIHLGVVIRALQQKNVLQILAEPNLMARSGEPARFIAGGEFPFPVVQGTGGNNAVSISFRPFGVRLDFTGTIGGDGVIRLKVAPEVSALDFANSLTISGFNIPAISTRRAETEIELRDGQSFGIAGLLDHRTTQTLSRIPGIGDIPILGYLFKSKNLNRSNTELLVLVTPTIVDPVGGHLPAVREPPMPLPNLQEQEFDKGVSKPTGAPSAK